MAVSLKKPHDRTQKADQSNPSVSDRVRGYTPVHQTDEEVPTQVHSARQDHGKAAGANPQKIFGKLPERSPAHLLAEGETDQLRSVQQNSDKAAAADSSKKLLVTIVVLAVVIVGLTVVMIVLLKSRGKDNFEPAALSRVSDSGQGGTETESKSLPPYGSMGSVIIHNVKYDIATTTELDLTGKNITDYELIELSELLAQFSNLTGLYLGSNHISNLAPLSKLTNLEDLYLGFNAITDITPLAGMTNLKSLGLEFNYALSDISLLAGLTNLDSLCLNYCDISNIQPLLGLTNLTSLSIMGNQIGVTYKGRLQAALPDCDIKF